MKRYIGVLLLCACTVLPAGISAQQEKGLEIAAELVESGDRAYQEGLEKGARAFYAKAASELGGANGPASQKLRRQMMSTCLDRKWTDEALVLTTDKSEPWHLLRLGELLRMEGRGAEMLDVFEQLLFPAVPPAVDDLAEEPSHAGARFGALREIACYQLHGEFVARYREAVDRDPQNAALRGELGYLLWQAGNYGAAEMEIRELLATKVGRSWYSLVVSFYRDTGRLGDAMRLLESVRNAPVTEAEVRSYARTCAAFMTPEETRRALRRRRLRDLGELLACAGKLKDAEDCYLEILEIIGSSGPAKEAQKALSEVPKKKAQTSKAIKKLEKELQKSPTDHAVAAQVGGLLFSLGMAEEAAAQYRAAVKLAPQEARYHACLARALAAVGQSKDALLEYRRALELLPVIRARPWLYLAEPDYDVYLREVEDLCGREGRGAFLLEIYGHELLRLRAESAADESSLADRAKRNLQKTSSLLEAAGDCDKVLALWIGERQRFFEEARRNILRCARRHGNAAASLSELHNLAERRPDDYSARTLCADLLYVTGRTEEALAQYDSVSRDLPAESAFHAELGRIYRERSLPEKALAEYRIAMGHARPGSRLCPEALQDMARVNMELKRFGEAAKLYEQALGQDPADLHARRHLMACRHALGQPARVPQALASEQLAKARGLAAAKRFSEAIPIYERLVEARPTNLDVLVELCDACQNARQDEKELTYLAWLVKLRPWSSRGWNQQWDRLAKCYEMRKEEEKLVELYRVLGDYDRLRRQLKRKGALSEYIDIMQQEVTFPSKWLGGRPTSTRQRLVSAYLEVGRTEEARRLCDALYDYLMSADPMDSQGAVALGALYEELGEFDKGIAVIQRALESPERSYRRLLRERRASLRKKRARAE